MRTTRVAMTADVISRWLSGLNEPPTTTFADAAHHLPPKYFKAVCPRDEATVAETMVKSQ